MNTEFFNKAKENLKAAQICFDNGLYNACANRTYYATLHAAVAALAAQGIIRERIEPEWVHAEFSDKLVNRKKVYPAHLKSYLRDMQTERNIADYTVDSVSKKKAQRWLAKAQEMMTSIEKELKR